MWHGGFNSDRHRALSNLSDESNTSSEEEEKRSSTSEAEFESLTLDTFAVAAGMFIWILLFCIACLYCCCQMICSTSAVFI